MRRRGGTKRDERNMNRSFRIFCDLKATSALPLKRTFAAHKPMSATPNSGHVQRNVMSAQCHSGHRGPYSITSSARATSVDGTAMPSAFAVLRLISSLNVVGCVTGKSAGLVPECAPRKFQLGEIGLEGWLRSSSGRLRRRIREMGISSVLRGLPPAPQSDPFGQ